MTDEKHSLWAILLIWLMNNDNILLTNWRNDENLETQKPTHRNPCSMMEFASESHFFLIMSILPGNHVLQVRRNVIWQAVDQEQYLATKCLGLTAFGKVSTPERKQKSNSNIFGPPIIPTSSLYRFYMNVTQQQSGSRQGVQRMLTSDESQRHSW